MTGAFWLTDLIALAIILPGAVIFLFLEYLRARGARGPEENRRWEHETRLRQPKNAVKRRGKRH